MRLEMVFELRKTDLIPHDLADGSTFYRKDSSLYSSHISTGGLVLQEERVFVDPASGSTFRTSFGLLQLDEVTGSRLAEEVVAGKFLLRSSGLKCCARSFLPGSSSVGSSSSRSKAECGGSFLNADFLFILNSAAAVAVLIIF